MINISRSSEAPSSLVTKKIQDFIDACILHKEDPDTNPLPDKKPAYRNSDLLDALGRDFYNKCYLTEQKFANAYVMDVEHFIPKNEQPELRYDWNNLFPAEHRANMVKPRKNPVGGYLNPCDPNDDVENQIIYGLIPDEYGISVPTFDAIDDTCLKTKNTCKLLNKIHNGDTPYSTKSSEELRFAINAKYARMQQLIIDFTLLNPKEHPNLRSVIIKRNEIKLHLSRKSSFSMLIRSMSSVRNLLQEFPNEFELD